MQFCQKIILLLLFLLFTSNIFGQLSSQEINATYQRAINFYNQKDYKNAAAEFDKLYPEYSAKFTNSNTFYNGACIYALNNEKQKALELLKIAVFDKFYFNLNNISNDSDLVSLHNEPQWQTLIDGVKENIRTLPERNKGRVKAELLKAKAILEQDAGKLWGESIWSDDYLVIDIDNTVYSLSPFPDSKTDNSGIYYLTLPPNTIGYSNSRQPYKGKFYATIKTNDLFASPQTFIHELFHILQFKNRDLNGEEIAYLDNYDARELLRLEFQSLRNCLNSINQNQDLKETLMFLNDAMIFRKLRQTKYKEFLAKDTELETHEGLANYTGFVLAPYPMGNVQNKYQRAVVEIDIAEQEKTFVRRYAYATGFSYALILDHLKIDWKKGLKVVYNFSDIYEKNYLKRRLKIKNKDITAANLRNNFAEIHQQEFARKEKMERLIAILKKEFIENPTLSVTLKDEYYAQTSAMDSATIIPGIGTVFKVISGRVIPEGKRNFGDFKILPTDDETAGVLRTLNGRTYTFVFPTPFKIEGNKITGKYYEIELAPNWTVKKKNEKGDYEIAEKEEEKK
ncbi:MAG: hypothetical protein K1X72_23775 [Pyrinomonadaceae bacterium]|nr:hypothetical protein [Pyrinomonadaceae bacterium]